MADLVEELWTISHAKMTALVGGLLLR